MSEKRSRILVIGASGTIGSAVREALSERHDVITAGSSSGDVRLDIRDPGSIRKAFEQLGRLDAVITALGKATFAAFDDFAVASLDASSHRVGIEDKLMGQMNVAQCARDYLADGGSITLTSGILNVHPVPGSVSVSMVNGALEAFVVAASTEMRRGLRINIVSPTLVEESMAKYGPVLRGFRPVPARDVALGYTRSVESLINGQVIRVW